MGRDGAVVMEGRDIGTVVFPTADLKIYIDASAEERARRRAADPTHSASNIASLQTDMAARDRSDSTRLVAPLSIAGDAVYIDTTAMPIESVVDQVMALLKDKL